MKDINNLLTLPSTRSTVFCDNVVKPIEGLQRYYVIMTAFESGLLEYTVTPKTYNQIAQHFGYHQTMTQMFCDALTDLELLTKTDDKYKNSHLTQMYLNRDSSRFMIHTLTDIKKNANLWSQLPDLLKNGPVKRDRKGMFGDGRVLRIAEWCEAGSVYNVINLVSECLDVKRWRKLLDVGGGHGLYAIAFAALNPPLEAYVFDQPHVTPITQENIDAYGAKNVHIISGDYNKDEIGDGYDAIFSSFNQTCNDPAHVPKLFNALNPGGDLMLRRHKEKSKQDAMRTLDWNLIHYEGMRVGRKPHGGDNVIRKVDYIKCLEDAGFSVLDCKSVDAPSELLFVKKPSDRREQ